MEHDLYKTPQSSPADPKLMASGQEQYTYAGFWIRFGAAFIDGLLIVAITLPLMISIYGSEYLESEKFFHGKWDLVINYILPAVVVITFWVSKSATPGKMLCKLKIINVNTGEKPSTGQFIVRYFGYFLSAIPLLLGYVWAAFDERKQGWHDKVAGAAVVNIE